MSLPGLQISTTVEVVAAPVIHDLNEGTEWRFEVAFGSSVHVKLLSGAAELFGTELALKQNYYFTGTKVAIYTWHGCRIEVVGDCQVEYLAEETPMISYANVHFALERMREQASVDSRDGPRVLVVGPENAGKTSLVKLLTAYATRTGRQPIVVNLDTKEGSLSIPGSLSATAFSSILDVEEGWGSSPTNGPSQVPVKLPLVYYYGLANPEENTKVFKPIVTRLALSVRGRLQDDAEAKEAGCIIDTPGVISQGKGGYEVIQHIVSEFSISVLIILGSERLYSDMLRRFNGQKTSTDETISVIKLDKSGGCVDRDDGYQQHSRQAQVREYFFGDAKTALSPHTQQLDFSQLTIYKLAETSDLLASLLPGGEAEDTGPAPIFEKLQPSSLMQNSILAIVHADPNDTQENIRDASVLGFVYIAEVDEKRKKVKVLAPLSGRLPNRAMVWGSWPEGVGDLVG
ncbi:Cleavage polyadenylation factor subunit clp1 [Toensbergia leucococca]|nr:Cleavage polyadenylation factor subunit clp1 [Toensbergia leucococca]